MCVGHTVTAKLIYQSLRELQQFLHPDMNKVSGLHVSWPQGAEWPCLLSIVVAMVGLHSEFVIQLIIFVDFNSECKPYLSTITSSEVIVKNVISKSDLPKKM